jgi:hypothetical protein
MITQFTNIHNGSWSVISLLLGPLLVLLSQTHCWVMGSLITNVLFSVQPSHTPSAGSLALYKLGWPDILFLRKVCHCPNKNKMGHQLFPFFNSVVYNWYRFFVMAYKQHFELRYLEWKSPSYFNKPSYVLLDLFWSVKLNLSNIRALYMSAVTERLQQDVIKFFHLNVSELRNM